MNVLHRQTWIRLVEPDRSAVRSRREVNKLLKVLSAGRGWSALGELEKKIEDRSDVLGEIGDVLVERAVVYREETDLIVFQLDELCEMGCSDFVEVLRRSAAPCPQDQFHLYECKF